MYRFKSILKQTLWGGEKIKQLKHIPDAPSQIGESWELSAVEGNVSTIEGGSEDGVLLTDLIDRDKERLMGRRNYERFGHRFPLLIKFIDAKQDLSIQVHPNDEIAHRQGLPCGKTEMWYLMPSEDDAVIRVGLKKKITPEEYKQMVANNTITDAIAHYNVKAGDCFFLPGGRIHSIGAGCML
ncbi:MAG: class I mannose-6-phosphate isomerase, partial [Bacteroidales bacterium]|nr:class I mannose-6-phosphate isomerase [Bacteroidales bacterium]